MLNKPQAYLTKVFIQIFLRNKQYIIFSLILPLLILGIVRLNDGDTDPIDIGLVNNSESNLSQELIEQLTSNKLFNVIQDSEDKLRTDLINGDLMIMLIIPKGMNIDEDNIDIKLLVDKSQTQFIQTMEPILNQSLLSIERKITGNIPLFELVVEDIKSRTLTYIDFLLPGIMAFMLMNLSIAGSGFNVVEFRRRGILKRLFVTPIKPIDFVIAIVLARMVIVLGQLSIIFSFALFILDANMVGNIFNLYFVIVLGVLMFLTLGFSLGSLAKTQESVGVMATIFIYPQLVLSGVFFPLESLPVFIQPFAEILPLTLVADAMRSIANDGLQLVDVYLNFIGIAIWIVIGMLVSTKLFVWKEVAG